MKRLSFSEMQALQNDQLNFLQRLAAENGGITYAKMLWYRLVFVNEPALIRELLVKHAHHLHRDPFVSNVFKRFMGNGVFIVEGETWKKQRKLVQPAFHATRINQYADIMTAYTREMIADWSAGDTIAVDEAFTQLTLRIIAKTMYGVDLESQTAEIGRLMGEVAAIAQTQLDQGFVPPEWVPTRQNRRQKKLRMQVEQLLSEIIHQRQESGIDHGDLLSMLLQARDEDDRPMSEQQLVDECLTLFFAGHETTAATLTWLTYLLAENDGVLAKLKTEIAETLGDRPITFEDVRQMPYLEAVVKEALRLYPPAHSVGRSVQEPFSVDGHHFPKGAVVIINIFVTHRRADLFENPAEFRPERFLDSESQPERYAYMPFGAGPRVCLGNMFAMLEASVILATLLQRFMFERATSENVVIDNKITLRPRDPLHMIVKLA